MAQRSQKGTGMPNHQTPQRWTVVFVVLTATALSAGCSRAQKGSKKAESGGPAPLGSISPVPTSTSRSDAKQPGLPGIPGLNGVTQSDLDFYNKIETATGSFTGRDPKRCDDLLDHLDDLDEVVAGQQHELERFKAVRDKIAHSSYAAVIGSAQMGWQNALKACAAREDRISQ